MEHQQDPLLAEMNAAIQEQLELARAYEEVRNSSAYQNSLVHLRRTVEALYKTLQNPLADILHQLSVP